MSERMDYETAKRRMNEIKGLYIHAAVFALVILILFAVDIATGSPYWVHWVVIGWGVGIVGHYALIHGSMPHALRDWEKRKIEELMGSQSKSD